MRVHDLGAKTSRLVEELKAARLDRARRAPTPTGNASFAISRKAGAKPIGSWRCATRRSPSRSTDGRAGAIPIVRYAGVQLSGVRDQYGRTPIDLLVGFYSQRAGAENLIKEANNDAGLAAHPSARWMMNCNHFQLAMLAYNLNCWLMLFNREEQAKVDDLRHTTLATARLRFLFLAAKIWRHAGRVGVSYSDHYEEKGIFGRLMDRLRAIAADGRRFVPVLTTPLTG